MLITVLVGFVTAFKKLEVIQHKVKYILHFRYSERLFQLNEIPVCIIYNILRGSQFPKV